MAMIHATPPIVSRNRGGLRQCVKSLIFGAPKPITTSERDNPQEAVSLLRQLPFEIRAQIWSEYFHGTTNKRLAHIKAYAKSATDCIAKDWQSFHPDAHLNCYYSKQKCNCLSLLLTCRWIYLECVPLLYRTTLFDFTCLYTVSNFRKRIPACHFANISHVNVTISVLSRDRRQPADKSYKSGHKYQWPLMWETLAAMDSLQWLRFELLLFAYQQTVYAWTAKLDRLLWPVKKVTRPAHFELILPFDIGERARELPCQVIRSEAKDVFG